MQENLHVSVESIKPDKTKRSLWQRIDDLILRHDITYGLAVFGFILINAVMLWHFKFTRFETILMGLGLGFVIPRLLK